MILIRQVLQAAGVDAASLIGESSSIWIDGRLPIREPSLFGKTGFAFMKSTSELDGNRVQRSGFELHQG